MLSSNLDTVLITDEAEAPITGRKVFRGTSPLRFCNMSAETSAKSLWRKSIERASADYKFILKAAGGTENEVEKIVDSGIEPLMASHAVRAMDYYLNLFNECGTQTSVPDEKFIPHKDLVDLLPVALDMYENAKSMGVQHTFHSAADIAVKDATDSNYDFSPKRLPPTANDAGIIEYMPHHILEIMASHPERVTKNFLTFKGLAHSLLSIFPALKNSGTLYDRIKDPAEELRLLGFSLSQCTVFSEASEYVFSQLVVAAVEAKALLSGSDNVVTSKSPTDDPWIRETVRINFPGAFLKELDLLSRKSPMFFQVKSADRDTSPKQDINTPEQN